MRERRSYVRADGLVLVNYKIPELKLEGKSSAYDLSGAGVRITVARKLKPGTPAELEMYLPGSSQPILAKAEVTWADKCEKTDYFYAGLKFKVIDENSKNRIMSYVHRKLIQYKQEGKGRHSQI